MENSSKYLMFVISFVFLSGACLVSASVLLSDQGTDVKNKSTGQLLLIGNLTITIYDNASSGNLIFNQTYSNSIANGSWNLMLSPDLEFGNTYWKDYEINGQDIDFDGNERISFQSPLGLINNASRINFSLIQSCSAGSSIRLVYENGSVECETAGAGSGESYNATYAGLINNASYLDTYNATYDAKNTSRWLLSNGNISFSTGSVGIGTTEPEASLEVISANFPVARIIRSTALTMDIRSTFQAEHRTTGDMVDGFGADISFSIRDNASVSQEIANFGGKRDGADDSGALAFYTYNAGNQGNPDLLIKPDGKVGIGTSTPTHELNVVGDINFTGDLIGDYREMVVTKFPADAYLHTLGSLGSATNFARLPVAIMDDGVTTQMAWAFKAPAGATGVSSVKVMYNNQAAEVLVLRMTFWGEWLNTDAEGAERSGAAWGNQNIDSYGTANKSGIIDVSSDAWTGCTLDEGDFFWITAIRSGDHGDDTYGDDLEVFGVEVTFD